MSQSRSDASELSNSCISFIILNIQLHFFYYVTKSREQILISLYSQLFEMFLIDRVFAKTKTTPYESLKMGLNHSNISFVGLLRVCFDVRNRLYFRPCRESDIWTISRRHRRGATQVRLYFEFVVTLMQEINVLGQDPASQVRLNNPVQVFLGHSQA